jgi:hypothetical protein
MAVQRRIAKKSNIWAIFGVILLVICILGLIAMALGGIFTQLF